MDSPLDSKFHIQDNVVSDFQKTYRRFKDKKGFKYNAFSKNQKPKELQVLFQLHLFQTFKFPL